MVYVDYKFYMRIFCTYLPSLIYLYGEHVRFPALFSKVERDTEFIWSLSYIFFKKKRAIKKILSHLKKIASLGVYI